MRWLLLLLSLTACRAGVRANQPALAPQPRCPLPSKETVGENQLFRCMCIERDNAECGLVHVICTSSSCQASDACRDVADWYHGTRVCSPYLRPEILEPESGSRCWEMDERPSSRGDWQTGDAEVSISWPWPEPPPAFRQMLSHVSTIRDARTVEVVRLGVPTETVSRTGFVELEKWTLGNDKAESLRKLFSATQNFTQDDPGLYRRYGIVFTHSFVVRFDDVDVLIDVCAMWVKFGRIYENARALSIREPAALQLAKLLVDVVETQRKGCLSLRIEDSKAPATRQPAGTR